MRSLLAALQFLTVIPVPVRLDERDFQSAPFWFPLVGLLLGGLAVLADTLMVRTECPGLLPSILTIGWLSALTGGLHLDGLADTADGFLSARPRARVLEIMRDSRIGTMGVLALLLVLAVKVAALAELAGAMRWKALLWAPLAGRSVQVIVMSLLPYARKEGGLAAVFLNGRSNARMALAGLCLLSSALLLFGLRSASVNLAAVVVISATASLWSLRRIGGFTGDTLGATSEMIEAAVLVAALVD